MDIQDRIIWQQAAGDNDRNYVQVCIDFDVILVGPGRYGPWPTCKSDLKQNKWTSKKITDLRRFCEDIQPGHLVVLKLGTADVYAVGEVVEPYQSHKVFGDIDGWDLDHVRRVRWLWHAEEKPKTFSRHTLKFGDTTQHLHAGEVTEWLKTLIVDPAVWHRPLAALPMDTAQEFKLDEIAKFSVGSGIIAQPMGSVVEQLHTIVDLASWYSSAGQTPSEYETVSYLVQPLLRLLGWSPQQTAIEWQNIDVALFSSLPRKDDNLTMILEAKRRDRSCLHALPQAKGYAKNRPHCRRIILTDGIRYWVYVKRGEVFAAHAHLNLRRLRAAYPVYHCAGAKEALQAMVPGWSDSPT